MRIAPSLCFALLLVACGDDVAGPGGQGGAGGGGGSGAAAPSGGGGQGGVPYDGPCTVLSVGDTSVFFDSFGRGTIAPVTPGLDGVHHTRITMELYEDEGMPALTPGTFPFADAPDDDYGTCQHCALLVGYDAAGTPTRAFYPRSGALTLEDFAADDPTIVAARVEGAELFEVRQNEDLSWEFLPGDACYYVERWAFDTTPVDGAACLSAEECPNEAYQVCSPATNRCAPGECNLFGDPPYCDAGQTCLSQLWEPDGVPFGPAIGACYETCATDDDCGDGRACRVLGPTQSLGVCLARGTAALGAACAPEDNATACEAGAVCWGEPGECLATCAYLTDGIDCPDDRFCTLSNLCKPAGAGDAAAVGGACDEATPELTACGVEGDAFAGLCMRLFLEEELATCERLCRIEDPACPAGESCLGLFSNPEVGLCRPTPECGDGVLDVVGGELCDDGDLDPGGACNESCDAADFAFLCAGAATLALDVDVPGDTTGGPSGYASDCDPFVATPTTPFSFVPPAPGRLTLSLTGAPGLDLSVHADCEAPEERLGCSDDLGDDELVVEIATVDASPILVVVRGRYPLAEGPFTLRAHFDEAVCGDGTVMGPEACDDGNQDGGDGCAGDCLTVEWAEVCADLPTLPASDTATTLGGQPIYALDGICAFDPAEARAYAYVAPSDGTLRVSVTEPDEDLVIYVQDGCGPVTGDDYVACGNSSFQGMGESTEALLEEGQAVTVIVAGFDSSGGAYALTSTFEPTP